MTAPIFQIPLFVGELTVAPPLVLIAPARPLLRPHVQRLAQFGRRLVQRLLHGGNVRLMAVEVKP